MALFGDDRHYHTHNTKVVEERAPTDESIKILREMEEKALTNVVSRGMLNVGSIEAEIAFVLFYRPEFLRHELRLRAIFNGTRVEHSYVIEDMGEPSREILYDAVKEAAKELVAQYIFVDILHSRDFSNQLVNQGRF